MCVQLSRSLVTSGEVGTLGHMITSAPSWCFFCWYTQLMQQAHVLCWGLSWVVLVMLQGSRGTLMTLWRWSGWTKVACLCRPRVAHGLGKPSSTKSDVFLHIVFTHFLTAMSKNPQHDFVKPRGVGSRADYTMCKKTSVLVEDGFP